MEDANDSGIRGYRDLRVWQKAMDIAVLTYSISKSFPRDEIFGLTSQARRAAASVAANIAEGYGRGTRPAYISFLRISQGSLKDLETHMMLAVRVGITESKAVDHLLSEADHLGRMLRTLLKKLASSAPIPSPKP